MTSKDINFFGKKVSQEEFNKAFQEELIESSQKAMKWTIAFVQWYLVYKSLTVYWWNKDVLMSILYSIMSMLISISQRIYRIETKLKDKGVNKKC